LKTPSMHPLGSRTAPLLLQLTSESVRLVTLVAVSSYGILNT